jgi:hypothetical protein
MHIMVYAAMRKMVCAWCKSAICLMNFLAVLQRRINSGLLLDYHRPTSPTHPSILTASAAE